LIHDRPQGGWPGRWAQTTAALALCAFALHHPDRDTLAAHVFAERPTEQDVGGVVRAVETSVELALLLAPVDRAAARVLLDAAEARKDLIGSGGQNVRHREYLAAWCFVDPNRIVRVLTAAVG